MTVTCDTCGKDVNPYDPKVGTLERVEEIWTIPPTRTHPERITHRREVEQDGPRYRCPLCLFGPENGF